MNMVARKLNLFLHKKKFQPSPEFQLPYPSLARLFRTRRFFLKKSKKNRLISIILRVIISYTYVKAHEEDGTAPEDSKSADPDARHRF